MSEVYDKKTKYVTDFTQGNVTTQLISFATPLFFSNLLQIVYGMVDTVIVGRKLGATGLSAVSVGGDVVAFLTFMAMGFSNAGQVIISQYIGSGEKRKISGFIGTMFSFLSLIAVTLSALCLVLRRPIMHIMNTPAEALDEALNYATVCMAGLLFIYGYNILSAVLRGMGDSRRPFLFISIAAVLNVVLDVLFVLVFDFRCMGAALATVISQSLSFILCGIFILKNREKYDLEITLKDFLPKGEYLSRLVKLGFPMAIKNASVQFSKLFVNSWINSYGVIVSAFAGIANKINSTTNLISTSFNTAGSSMVGQNIGAQKYERVKKIMLSVFGIMLCIETALSVLFIVFPQQIYGFFTKDAAVIDIGMKFIPIAVLLFYGSAARSGMNSLINGSGQYLANFATAILDGIVMRIGLAVLFGLVLKMDHYGFWLGDALAGYTPFFIGLCFYFSGKWKRGRPS